MRQRAIIIRVINKTSNKIVKILRLSIHDYSVWKFGPVWTIYNLGNNSVLIARQCDRTSK